MPPSMSANNDENEQQLTNEEIENLYEIVQYAQTLPDPPYRALFTAYDQKNRLEDGSRCFTFLLRMQENGAREKGNLIATFQRLLLEEGIQVEVDPTGEGVEVTESQLEISPRERDAQPTETRELSRRGSFDSYFDGAADKVPGTDYAHGLPYRSRRSSTANSRIRKKRRSRSNTEDRTGALGLDREQGQISGLRARRTVSDQIPIRPRRSASMSSRGSLRIIRNENVELDNETQDLSDYDGDDSQHTDSFDRSNVQIPGINAPIPELQNNRRSPRLISDSIYRPSDTQVMRDAELFDAHRITALARRYLQKWSGHASRLQDLEAEAIAFDKKILLKASIDSWRVAQQNNHAAIETERFFGHLGTRTDKARNLFLLTKAFTHWAKLAGDEVQRTSVARRHILRTKYFNAWRDITAVNELKIQHFVLGSFLRRWRARTAFVQEQNDLAIDLRQENVKMQTYWKWFHAFANRNAPSFHAKKLARHYFYKWLEITRVTREREAFESYRRDRNVVRDLLNSLRDKAIAVRNMEVQADEFRRTKRLSSGLSILSKQRQLCPIARMVEQKVDVRVEHSALQIWRQNTRLNQQAKRVDRERILRNAFTAWNDALRTKELKGRIDDRVLIGCLYKWVLASRLSLMQRVRNHSQQRNILTFWVARTQDHEARLENMERRFHQYKRAQLLRSCLRKLEDATVERRNREYLAISMHDPKLKQSILTTLISKHDTYRQMNEWADRAQWYITTKHAVRKWQQATEASRRNRRREAYSQFRRKVKMNLVRRTLDILKNKAAQVASNQQRANQYFQDRLNRTSTDLLEKWRDRLSSHQGAYALAMQQDTSALLSVNLFTWVSKSRALSTMESQAVALRQESTEIVAASSLKKLGWRLWNVQQQVDTAKRLHERNFKKHARAMIRFWLEQTTERLAVRPTSPSPSARAVRQTQTHVADVGNRTQQQPGIRNSRIEDRIEESNFGFDESGDETRRLEAWTAFDENALGVSNLDLSFSISPSRQETDVQPVETSHLRSLPHRPATFPQPQSALRPPPITELPDLEDEDEGEFWTSTPMPPSAKPGYLKTPSKRSVARAKHPELPKSPEKRNLLPAIVERQGTASAPPVSGYPTRIPSAGGGVTSFERRLREGGFGGVGSNTGGARRNSRWQGRWRPRVGFEESEIQ